MKKKKTDQQKYRYEIIPVKDDSSKSFLLFETRYFAEKYIKEKLLSREEELSLNGKFDLEHKVYQLKEGFVIMRIARALV